MSGRVQVLLEDLAAGARDLGLRDLAADLDRFATSERTRVRGPGGRFAAPPDDELIARRILRAVETRT